MISSLPQCSRHHYPQQVIIRGEQNLIKLICRQCSRSSKLIHPHIILNDHSKQFFLEWSLIVIDHYTSIVVSIDSLNPLPVFTFPQNLIKYISEIDLKYITQDILKSELQVHQNNVNFIHKHQSLDNLLIASFMNDLLNIFNEPVICNLGNLIKMLKNILNDRGIIIFEQQTTLNLELVNSLENAKMSIKSKYFNQAQLPIEEYPKQSYIQQNSTNDNGTLLTAKKQVELFEENNMTIKKQINNAFHNLQTNSVIHENGHSQLQRSQLLNGDNITNTVHDSIVNHHPIVELHPQKDIQNLINKLQADNEQLLNKVAQLQHFAQESQIIINHRDLELANAQTVIFEKSNQNQSIIYQFQRAKIQLENIQKQLRLRNQKLHEMQFENTVLRDQNKRIQEQMLHMSRDFPERIDNMINNLQSNAKKIKLSEEKNQLKNYWKNQIRNQHNSEYKSDYKNDYKNERKSLGIDNLAKQIKTKIGKINTLVKASSTPSLSKYRSQKNKLAKLAKSDGILEDDKYSQNGKINLDTNLLILNQQVEYKNKQISSLNNNNKQLVSISNQLKFKIEQLERSSNILANDLQKKIRENQEEIDTLKREKDEHEAQIYQLKQEINDILSIRDQMEVNMENREKIIAKLNQKIANIQRQIQNQENKSGQNQNRQSQNGQSLNEELLEEVIEYQASLQRRKTNLKKVLDICYKIIRSISQEDYETFYDDIQILEVIKQQELSA